MSRALGHAQPAATSELTALVYELLDAHADTARLVDELEQRSLRWDAHLDYLRALQRVAREQLARAATKEPA